MTPTATLRLGTRRSPLALAQARLVATDVERAWSALGTTVSVELVEITSAGDQSSAPLITIGGTGVFVTALRTALREGRIDIAVHSLKDLPTAVEQDLVVAALPVRGDARDALCARDGLDLAGLPAGSRIGTGSPRRAAQLLALGLGFEVVDIRGNLGTRLAAVADGRLDAVVLALAGLQRAGLTEHVTEVIDPIQMLPAPGQGALAIECLAEAVFNGVLLSQQLAVLDDADTRAVVTAERALLAALEAGCSAPVGALAEVSQADAVEGEMNPVDELYLRGVLGGAQLGSVIKLSSTGPVTDPVALGNQLAAALLAAGDHDLSATPSPGLPAASPVFEPSGSLLLEKENVL